MSRWHKPRRRAGAVWAAALRAGACWVAAVWAAGCGGTDEAPPPTAPEAEAEPAPAVITAVAPPDGSREVGPRPLFRWRLPKHLAEPTTVTFNLFEAGSGPEPVRDPSRQRRLATATGLAAGGAEGLDPWKPPGGAVLTGPLADMAGLPPGTWFRWSVRVVTPTRGGHADFYFRTRPPAKEKEE